MTYEYSTCPMILINFLIFQGELVLAAFWYDFLRKHLCRLKLSIAYQPYRRNFWRKTPRYCYQPFLGNSPDGADKIPEISAMVRQRFFWKDALKNVTDSRLLGFQYPKYWLKNQTITGLEINDAHNVSIYSNVLFCRLKKQGLNYVYHHPASKYYRFWDDSI